MGISAVLLRTSLTTILALALPLRLTAAEVEGSAPADPTPEGAAQLASAPVVIIEERAGDAADPSGTSANVTVLRLGDDLPAGATVADVLQSAAGVHLIQLGGLGDFTSLRLRGSTPQQVQIFVDGLPVVASGGGGVDLARLPADAFDAIEVWRSGAPLTFGVAPIGGVINLVTSPPDRARVRVQGSGGSWGTTLGSASAVTRLGAPWLRLDASAFQSEGDYPWLDNRATLYTSEDDVWTVRQNNDKADVSGRAYLHLPGERGPARAWVSADHRQAGIAGPGYAPTRQVRYGSTQLRSQLELERGREALAGEVQLDQQWQREQLLDLEGELGLGTLDEVGHFHQLGVTTSGSWLHAGESLARMSVDVRGELYQQVDHTQVGEAPWYRRHLGVVGASESLALRGGAARVEPSLQLHVLDPRGLEGAESTTAGTLSAPETTPTLFLAPRLGVAITPAAGWLLKANAQRTFRPPDFTELFGHQGVTRGNPSLRPERGLGGDVGALWTPPGGELSLSGGAFATWSQDLIIYVQNAQQTLLPVNFGEALVAGTELSASWTPAGAWWMEGALTLTSSRNLDPRDAYYGNRLPQVPLGVGTTTASWSGIPGVVAGGRLSWTAGTYRDATNWYLAAPRTLLSAWLRASPERWGCGRCGGLFVEAEVRNLLNHQVELAPANPLDPGDTTDVVKALEDFAGYPLPGRTWLVSAGWESP